MPAFDSILDTLEQQPIIGYLPGSSPAAEPTAIAALALAAHGRLEAAERAAAALSLWQTPAGAVPLRSGEDGPGWPTSLAICAWCALPQPRQAAVERGLAWLLANRGKVIERSADFGHNTELVGWAYAEQTHSWVEPTALAVLALKAAGQSQLPQCREAIAMLIDRQLPGGGHNYGNTYVLGQLIRPHVQPTGLALLALAGEQDASGRIEKSIAWLRRSLTPRTTPQSLGWALLGLKAHQVADTLRAPALAVGNPSSSDCARSVPATYRRALLALAAKGWPV